MRGATFGCARCFHTTAIWWNTWGFLQHLNVGESVIKTYRLEYLGVSVGAHSYTLNPYLQSPLMYGSGKWWEADDREGT